MKFVTARTVEDWYETIGRASAIRILNDELSVFTGTQAQLERIANKVKELFGYGKFKQEDEAAFRHFHETKQGVDKIKADFKKYPIFEKNYESTIKILETGFAIQENFFKKIGDQTESDVDKMRKKIEENYEKMKKITSQINTYEKVDEMLDEFNAFRKNAIREDPLINFETSEVNQYVATLEYFKDSLVNPKFKMSERAKGIFESLQINQLTLLAKKANSVYLLLKSGKRDDLLPSYKNIISEALANLNGNWFDSLDALYFDIQSNAFLEANDAEGISRLIDQQKDLTQASIDELDARMEELLLQANKNQDEINRIKGTEEYKEMASLKTELQKILANMNAIKNSLKTQLSIKLSEKLTNLNVLLEKLRLYRNMSRLATATIEEFMPVWGAVHERIAPLLASLLKPVDERTRKAYTTGDDLKYANSPWLEKATGFKDAHELLDAIPGPVGNAIRRGKKQASKSAKAPAKPFHKMQNPVQFTPAGVWSRMKEYYRYMGAIPGEFYREQLIMMDYYDNTLAELDLSFITTDDPMTHPTITKAEFQTKFADWLGTQFKKPSSDTNIQSLAIYMTERIFNNLEQMDVYSYGQDTKSYGMTREADGTIKENKSEKMGLCLHDRILEIIKDNQLVQTKLDNALYRTPFKKKMLALIEATKKTAQEAAAQVGIVFVGTGLVASWYLAVPGTYRTIIDTILKNGKLWRRVFEKQSIGVTERLAAVGSYIGIVAGLVAGTAFILYGGSLLIYGIYMGDKDAILFGLICMTVGAIIIKGTISLFGAAAVKTVFWSLVGTIGGIAAISVGAVVGLYFLWKNYSALLAYARNMTNYDVMLDSKKENQKNLYERLKKTPEGLKLIETLRKKQPKTQQEWNDAVNEWLEQLLVERGPAGTGAGPSALGAATAAPAANGAGAAGPAGPAGPAGAPQGGGGEADAALYDGVFSLLPKFIAMLQLELMDTTDDLETYKWHTESSFCPGEADYYAFLFSTSLFQLS